MTRRHVRRVAMLAVHTSPLAQPGTGDAGGLNVFVDATARRLSRRGVAVDVFTRAVAPDQPPVVEVEPGYAVRHVPAGPFGEVPKEEMAARLCPFTAGVLRATATAGGRSPFDVVHSHYWLAGQVGCLLRDRWDVPLVHSSHTLARVKNAAAGEGPRREPRVREIGEEQVLAQADVLLAATAAECRELTARYGADPGKVAIVPPGVDLDLFRPDAFRGPRGGVPGAADRARLEIAPGEVVLVFAGRIQQPKGPAVLVRAAAALRERHPGRALRVLIAGGASGPGRSEPDRLRALVGRLGIARIVHLLPPLPPAELAGLLRAADVVAVPSYSESFGLVALEAQACGTPVVAADVGGLPVAVRDGHTGLLVAGHATADWADALAAVALDPARRARMSLAARQHAQRFSWDITVDALLDAYRRAEQGAGRGGGLAQRAGA